MEERKIKKVIFFIPTLSGGGAERVVSELSCNLPECIRQYIVLFHDKISYPHRAELMSLGLDDDDSRNIFVKAMRIIKRVVRFKKVVDAVRPDVVISFLQANTVNLLTRQCSKKNMYRAVISERTATSQIDMIMKGLYGFVNRTLMSLLYKKADKIVSVSEAIKYDLVRIFGVAEERITVIYNPIDAQKLSALAQEEVDHPWFMQTVPIIITVGRLSAQKDQKSLLEAFAYINKEKRCRLVIIGEGDLRDDLLRRARSLGVENGVSILGFQRNPFKYIARSKIFVLPSLFEGFPNALVEAMAIGCPVIAADCVSGPREILDPSLSHNSAISGLRMADFGILFPVGDIAAMADGMRLMLNDEKVRCRYADAAIKRARSFETGGITARYVDVLYGA